MESTRIFVSGVLLIQKFMSFHYTCTKRQNIDKEVQEMNESAFDRLTKCTARNQLRSRVRSWAMVQRCSKWMASTWGVPI